MNVPFVIWSAVMGSAIGSFLTVVVHRLPIMKKNRALRKSGIACGRFNLAYPRSQCVACSKPIKWYQNLPVLSYLALRGKTACCDRKIPFKYFALEVSFGALGGLIGWLVTNFYVFKIMLIWYNVGIYLKGNLNGSL